MKKNQESENNKELLLMLLRIMVAVMPLHNEI